MRLILLFLTMAFATNAQTNLPKIEYAIIKNVYPRGQVLEKTCWAASLEMLENAFGKKSTFQMDQINARYHGTHFTYSNFQRNNAISVKGKTIVELHDLIKNIGYTCDTASLLTWQKIKDNFRGPNASPIIVFKEYDDYSAHITTVIGYTEIELQPNVTSKTLLINDPWVKSLDSTGIQYGLNFDFFRQNRTKSLDQKFFYKFSKNNATLNQIENSTFRFNATTTSFRMQKGNGQTAKAAAKSFAKKNINTLTVSNAEVSKVLNLKSLTNLNTPVKVIYLDSSDFISKSAFQSKLANGQTHFYFSVVQNTDTNYVYVTTKDERPEIKKYTVMTERIEPYRNSVIKVLKAIELKSAQPGSSTPAQSSASSTTSSFMSMATPILPDLSTMNLDFCSIYSFQPYNQKPDFLLIPKKNNKNASFLLVDLFDRLKDDDKLKLPKIKGFELPMLNKPFNFSVYDFGIDDLSKLKTFLDKK